MKNVNSNYDDDDNDDNNNNNNNNNKGAWRWLPNPSSAEVKERVEQYLHSPLSLRGLF